MPTLLTENFENAFLTHFELYVASINGRKLEAKLSCAGGDGIKMTIKDFSYVICSKTTDAESLFTSQTFIGLIFPAYNCSN